MMNRKLAIAGWGLAIAFGTGACNFDKLTSVNDNPNNPTDAPPGTLFTQATRLTITRFLGAFDSRGVSLVAQHLAEVQYPESDQYLRLQGSFTFGNFNAAYSSELMDLEQVIRKGEALDAPGIYGPAMVMQTWTYGNLTDIWGDIPYSEALLADSVEFEGALTPAYDPQEEIYADFFQVLGKASTDMAAASASSLRLGAADPIYGGNLASWQRFSNSLRARHALRIVNVDPGKASTELAAAFAAPGGVFTSNAHNAKLTWPGDGVYDNPWATNFKTRDDHRISNRFMTYLLGWNDPRLEVFAQPTEANPALYVGLANALTHSEASTFLTTTSRPGEFLYPGVTAYGTFGGTGAMHPSYLMTYAEVLFIKAEAAERGLGGLTAGQAAGFYGDAIRASMDQFGVASAAEIAAYLASAEVAYKGGVEGLRQIAIQKWIALFTQGTQAWAEWRRTCQPANIKPGPEAIINTVPRRFEYSSTEYSVNEASVDAAIARQGPDEFETRPWWDSQPTAAPTYVAGCGVR